MIGASMEDESNETPSLPENYITLAQLQERWLKEQERKQIEKQNQEREMEQKLERENAERDRKKRDEEDDVKNRTLNGTTEEVAEASTHLRDRRYQHRRNQIQPAVVDDVARMANDSRQQQQKKKRKSWKELRERRNDSRASRTVAGETAVVQTEEKVKKVTVEKTQELIQSESEVERVVVNKTQVEQKFEGLSVDERGNSKIQINRIRSHLKGNQWVAKDKVLGDHMTSPIEQNFEGLSVNGGREGNVTPLEGRNGRKDKVLGNPMASPIEQNFEGLSVNGGEKGNVRPREGRNGRKYKVFGDHMASPVEQNFEGLSVNGGREGNVRPREGRNGRKDKELGVPIEQNFEGLSFNGGEKGNVRLQEGRNGRNEKYKRGFGRFDVHSQDCRGREMVILNGLKRESQLMLVPVEFNAETLNKPKPFGQEYSIFIAVNNRQKQPREMIKK